MEERIKKAEESQVNSSSEEAFLKLKSYIEASETRVVAADFLSNKTTALVETVVSRVSRDAVDEEYVLSLTYIVRSVVYSLLAGSFSLIDQLMPKAVAGKSQNHIDDLIQGVEELKELILGLVKQEISKEIALHCDYVVHVIKALQDDENIPTVKFSQSGETFNSPESIASVVMRAIEFDLSEISITGEKKFRGEKRNERFLNRGDRVIAFASGSAFLGGLIAQIPGAVIGALLGGMFGILRQDKTTNSAENS